MTPAPAVLRRKLRPIAAPNAVNGPHPRPPAPPLSPTIIKISVLYPNTAGSWFDHDYYRDVHMPKLKTLLGETCLYYTDTVPLIQINSVVVEHS